MSDQPTDTQPATLYRLTQEQVDFIQKMLIGIPVNGPLAGVRQVVAMADSIEEALARPVAAENIPGEKT